MILMILSHEYQTLPVSTPWGFGNSALELTTIGGAIWSGQDTPTVPGSRLKLDCTKSIQNYAENQKLRKQKTQVIIAKEHELWSILNTHGPLVLTVFNSWNREK